MSGLVHYAFTRRGLPILRHFQHIGHTTLSKRYFSTAQRVEKVLDSMERGSISFEEFKRQEFEDRWEEFTNSYMVQTVLGGDLQKAAESFQHVCRSRYNRLQQEKKGGNPGLMV